MIGQFLYKTLMNNPELFAETGDEIFPLVAPESAEPPYFVYKVEDEDHTDVDGIPAMTDYYVQLSIYSEDYDEMETLADLAKDILEDETAWHHPTGYKIEGCYFEDGDNGIDDEIGVFRKDQLYKIFTHKI